jgi:hypothetical protein
MASPATQQQAQPGSRFSIPPFTDDVYQPDNNLGLVTTLQQSAQVAVTGVIPFMQSDVVYGWIWKTNITETLTYSVVPVRSPYYPFQYYSTILLNMQYQYPSISVASGIDLAIINLFRPLRPGGGFTRNFWYSNMATPPAGMTTQVSQLYNTPTIGATTVATNPFFILELPASTYFDSYYELDEYGNPISGPHNGYISPQNMGGYARVVTPTVRANGVQASTADNGPYTAGTMTVATAPITHSFMRFGVLGSMDASVLPQPTNWQYNIAHQQITLSGRSSVDIPMNQIFAGQIMGIFVRLFDPSSGASGAPIPVANVKQALLTFGGSVQKFQGTTDFIQERLASLEMRLPIEGYLVFDLATDVQGWITNSYCLNTLRTASVQLHIDFTGTQSATAYAEVSIDGLRWVPLPVNPAQ